MNKIHKSISVFLTWTFIAIPVYTQVNDSLSIDDSSKISETFLEKLTYDDLIEMPYEDFIRLAEMVGLTVDELMDMMMKQEVVTASKQAQKTSEAPATIYTITSDIIEARCYTTLEEVLEDIPGVEIQKKSVSEYSNYYTIRGLSGNEKFVIMQDGVRINAIAGTPHVVANNYFIKNSERIEIIIGPGSALYGADALTGIINIISKEGEAVKGFNASSEYGSYNTLNNSFFTGYGNDKFSFIAEGNIYHSDEPPFYKLPRYEEEYAWYNERYKEGGELILDSDTVSTFPVAYGTPTNAYCINAKLKVNNFQLGYYGNSESHSTSIGMRPEKNIYAEDAIYKINIRAIYGLWDYKSDNERLSLNTKLSHSVLELSPESNFMNVYTSYERGYKYSINTSFKIEQQLNYQLSENLNLVTGISFEDVYSLPKTGDLPFKYDKNKAADIQDFYYLGTNLTTPEGHKLAIEQDIYNIYYKNYSGFAQINASLVDNLKLTLGSRYDYNTRYGGSINPRIALVYNKEDKLKSSLLYNEAFLAPSPLKAYEHFGSFSQDINMGGQVIALSSDYWHLPNDKLKPEKLRSAEFNTTYFLNKNLSIAVYGYYNTIDNLISIEGYENEVFKDIPIDYVERRVNKGKAYMFGYNAHINWLYFYGSLFNINSYISYSYVDGEIDGSDLYYAANRSVKAGGSISFQKLSLSPRINYRSKSYHKSLKDEDGNIASSPAFAYINLTGRYLVIDKTKFRFSLKVKISNLLDSKFYNLSFAGIEGFAKTPQDPIRFNIGLQIDIK